jgi:hypothetical protein
MANVFNKLVRSVNELSPTCRDATRLQSQALDGSLSLRQRIGLRIHLWLCRWCKRYGMQLRFLRSAAQRQSEHKETLPSQPLSPEARERMKVRLKAEDK